VRCVCVGAFGCERVKGFKRGLGFHGAGVLRHDLDSFRGTMWLRCGAGILLATHWLGTSQMISHD
jgi:hypothetical protein